MSDPLLVKKRDEAWARKIPESNLQKLLKDSFITCNSTPEGNYNVVIKTGSLLEAQQLHRLLIAAMEQSDE